MCCVVFVTEKVVGTFLAAENVEICDFAGYRWISTDSALWRSPRRPGTEVMNIHAISGFMEHIAPQDIIRQIHYPKHLPYRLSKLRSIRMWRRMR